MVISKKFCRPNSRRDELRDTKSDVAAFYTWAMGAQVEVSFACPIDRDGQDTEKIRVRMSDKEADVLANTLLKMAANARVLKERAGAQ